MNAEFNQLSRTAIEFKIIGNNYVEFIDKAIGTFIVSKTVDSTFVQQTKKNVKSVRPKEFRPLEKEVKDKVFTVVFNI